MCTINNNDNNDDNDNTIIIIIIIIIRLHIRLIIIQLLLLSLLLILIGVEPSVAIIWLEQRVLWAGSVGMITTVSFQNFMLIFPA